MQKYDPNEDGFPAPLDVNNLPNSESLEFQQPEFEDIEFQQPEFEDITLGPPEPVLDTETALIRKDLRAPEVPPPAPEPVKTTFFSRFSDSLSRVKAKLVENPDDFGLDPNQQVGTPPESFQKQLSEDISRGKDLTEAPRKVLLDQLEKITFEDDKTNYLWKTALQSSVTGSVLRESFAVEIDEQMEKDLNFGDKVLRTAMTMGPDIWLLGMGSMIPAAGKAAAAQFSVKSLPWFNSVAASIAANPITKAETMGAAMGFHEAIRQVYMNNLLENEDDGKQKFIGLMGTTLYDTLKYQASGMLMGKGQELRSALFGSSISPTIGLGRAATELVAEAPVIALVMSQMDRPGVLPSWDDFALAMGTMIGMEGVSLGRSGLYKIMRDGDPAFLKAKRSYERNGVAPETFAEDMHSDVRVLESVTNPLHDTVRPYDEAGGFPIPISDEVKIFQEAQKKLAAPTSPLVAPEAEGILPAMSVSTNPAHNTHVANLPGIDYPIPLQPGDSFEVITAPAGVQVALPNSYERSLSMSANGVVNNPILISLAESLGIRVKAGSKEYDPVLVPGPDGVTLGYFRPPESTRAKQIKTLEAAIKRSNNRIKEFQKQGLSEENTDFENRLLSKLTAELDEAKTSDLRASEGEIVINRLIANTPDGYVLNTVGHEIGHLLAYMNTGWENRQTTGLMADFHATLSGYPGVIEDVFAFSASRGIDSSLLREEGVLLSKMWRPQAIVDMSQSAYRMNGAELIADVVSVSLNRPDILARYAPNISAAMELFFEARPKVKEGVQSMLDILSKGKDRETVETMITQAANKGERLALDREKNRTEAAQKRVQIKGAGIQKMLFDSYAPIWSVVKQDYRVENAIQKLQFKTTSKQLYTTLMENYFVKPLNKLGVLQYEGNLIGLYRRIIGDTSRHDIFNTYGLTPEIADRYYKELVSDIETREGITGLHDSLNNVYGKFHEVRKATAIKRMEESGRYGDDYLDLIRDNEVWMHFDDIGHYEASIEKGLYPSKRRATKTKTGKEYENEKQIGSLSPIRDVQSASFEYDLALMDRLLHDNAVDALIKHGLRTGDFPVIPKSEFDMIVRGKSTEDIFDGYMERDFKSIGLPTRVLVEDTGRYETIRKEWMMPATLVDLFSNQSSDIQNFMSHVANNTFLDLTKTALKTGEGADILAATTKGMVNVNTVARYFMIVLNPAFQAKNAFIWDPSRAMVNLPNTGPFPLQGKHTLPGHYIKGIVESFQVALSGNLTPRVQSLLERNIVGATSRYTESEDLTGNTLSDRLLGMYRLKGYRNKVLWRVNGIGKELIGFLNRTVQGTAGALARAPRIAGERYFEEKRAKGLFTDISQEQQDVILRTALGEPATQIKGHYSTMANLIAPFFTAISMASRGSWRRAKANKTEAALNRIPIYLASTIAVLLELGFFDGDDNDNDNDGEGGEPVPKQMEIAATQTEFTLNNNLWIGLSIDSETGNGRGIKLPFTQDPELKMMHLVNRAFLRSLDQAMKEDPTDTKSRRIMDEILGIAAGAYETFAKSGGYMTPSLNPVLKTIGPAIDLLTKGNTREEFTDQMKHKNDLYFMGDRLKSVVDTAAKNIGVPKQIRNAPETLEKLFNPNIPLNEKEGSKALVEADDIPLYGQLFNVFYSDTDGGMKEKAKKELALSQSKVAAGVEIIKEGFKEDKKVSKALLKDVKEIASGEETVKAVHSFLDDNRLEGIKKKNNFLYLHEKYGNTEAFRAHLKVAKQYSPKAKEAYDIIQAQGDN